MLVSTSLVLRPSAGEWLQKLEPEKVWKWGSFEVISVQSISANLSSQLQVFVVLSVFFTCSWQRETDPLRQHWYSLESAGPESIFVSHPFIKAFINVLLVILANSSGFSSFCHVLLLFYQILYHWHCQGLAMIRTSLIAAFSCWMFSWMCVHLHINFLLKSNWPCHSEGKRQFLMWLLATKIPGNFAWSLYSKWYSHKSLCMHGYVVQEKAFKHLLLLMYQTIALFPDPFTRSLGMRPACPIHELSQHDHIYVHIFMLQLSLVPKILSRLDPAITWESHDCHMTAISNLIKACA